MLFRRAVLQRIAAGQVRLAFRRWRRPTVRAGGRLRTAVGELAITEVTPIDPATITEDEARVAGYPGRAALLAELAVRMEGEVHRIAFHMAGPDGRAALREDDALSPAELATLAARLDRMDRASADGPWTRRTLRLLAAQPGTPAAVLARQEGLARDAFKRRVRRLKELGLTESLSAGYRLSPRGRRFLDALSARE